ncbi:MAG: GDP-mannose 4,6-dehydratase [Promethearchaeota archaeon]
MSKIALITGITGQDGSYLAEYLLSKGYIVHGIIRRSSNFNTQRIDHIYRDPHESGVRLHLHYGDLSDFGSLSAIVRKMNPNEVYNLAAQSHVKVSFEQPEYTGIVDAIGTTSLLEALRRNNCNAKFYQASSSEMFGSSPPPQDENTPFHPRSPYAVAKVYAYWITINYREAYNCFACNGILFNHESPRRGKTFVTRKITTGLARIVAKKQKKLYMGNLDSKRDWGFAPEYIEAMWKVLNAEKPDDYVLGTGESYSPKEFLDLAFSYVGLDWQDYVEIDPKYFRPAEVDALEANPSKARKQLGWKLRISFEELVKIMVDCDFRNLALEPPGEGLAILAKKGFEWTDNSLTEG